MSLSVFIILSNTQQKAHFITIYVNICHHTWVWDVTFGRILGVFVGKSNDCTDTLSSRIFSFASQGFREQMPYCA